MPGPTDRRPRAIPPTPRPDQVRIRSGSGPVRARIGSGSGAEVEALEVAGGPPRVDVLEVGHRAGRVAAAVEALTPADGLALVVVVARRAVGVAEERGGVALDERDPRLLGLLG